MGKKKSTEKNYYILDGSQLTFFDVYHISHNEKIKVRIHPSCKRKVLQSRSFLEKEIKKRVIYGVNTGFGPMSNYFLPAEDAKRLQANLIRSHAVGFGDSLPPEFIIAIMIVRLNNLLRGHSGVRWEVVERLLFYINQRVAPVIPRHGSVGASGDLVQLAHIALGLIGEGNAWFEGRQRKVRDILKKFSISPLSLEEKEGLSLINGTSAMTGLGCIECHDAARIYALSIAAGALSFELNKGIQDALSPFLQHVRIHPGQKKVARDIRLLLRGSRLVRRRSELENYEINTLEKGQVFDAEEMIQDVYSIRCIPQIMGPVHETIQQAGAVINREINAVTDNPVIDIQGRRFLHGGNFHGDYISLELDKLKIALARVAMLSERRINFFLNRNVNKRFPRFLNLHKEGITLALQGLQFPATSTAAEIQTLSFPNYVHSISTNADNQDIVSMGFNSALITKEVIEGVFHVITIEYITLMQAMDVVDSFSSFSHHAQDMYSQFRRTFPTIRTDKDISDLIPEAVSFIRNSLKVSVTF